VHRSRVQGPLDLPAEIVRRQLLGDDLDAILLRLSGICATNSSSAAPGSSTMSIAAWQSVWSTRTTNPWTRPARSKEQANIEATPSSNRHARNMPPVSGSRAAAAQAGSGTPAAISSRAARAPAGELRTVSSASSRDRAPGSAAAASTGTMSSANASSKPSPAAFPAERNIAARSSGSIGSSTVSNSAAAARRSASIASMSTSSPVQAGQSQGSGSNVGTDRNTRAPPPCFRDLAPLRPRLTGLMPP
jgi:hypothetical protein